MKSTKGCRSPIQLGPISREQLLGRVAFLGPLYLIRASVVNRLFLMTTNNLMRHIKRDTE